MSNFIELTKRETGVCVLVNLDYVELVIPDEDGGTVLHKYFPDSKSKFLSVLHVRESYNLVKQKIFAKQRSIHPDNFKLIEPKEKLLVAICDKLCRFPREIHDQDELDEICENCSLCEVLDS